MAAELFQTIHYMTMGGILLILIKSSYEIYFHFLLYLALHVFFDILHC